MRRLVLAATVCVAAACSAGMPDGDADDTWVGSISTAGAVTTVVNASGSMWAGRARLVEEASIGVAAGADESMFGQVDSVFATDD